MLKHIKFHRDIYESWRWFEMSIYEQLANIWAEVGRSINNKNSWNLERFNESIQRAYELFDISIDDKKFRNTPKLREILLIKELVWDYFFWDNEYKSDNAFFERYFFEISVIANEERRKKRLLKNKT